MLLITPRVSLERRVVARFSQPDLYHYSVILNDNRSYVIVTCIVVTLSLRRYYDKKTAQRRYNDIDTVVKS